MSPDTEQRQHRYDSADIPTNVRQPRYQQAQTLAIVVQRSLSRLCRTVRNRGTVRDVSNYEG